MNVLLVGCGYLGQRLALRLLAAGHTVFATTRTHSKAAQLQERLGVQTVVLDVVEPVSLEQLAHLQKLEAVVYCVGYNRNSGHPRRTVSVDGLRNLLVRLPGSVSRMVFTSSTSVYGPAPQDVIDETTPTRPVEEAGQVCLEAENLLNSYANQFEKTWILRLSGLYGPGRIIRRQSLEEGEPITADPDAWLNLIHVDDAARGTAAALEAQAPAGVTCVNINDDQPGPRRRYYELTARLLNAPAPVFAANLEPKEGSNRRRIISNQKMKQMLVPELLYPTLEAGVPAALAEDEFDGGNSGR